MPSHSPEDLAFSPGDLQMIPLDGAPPADFDCGVEEQNGFLRGRAWRDQCQSISVTHVLYVKGVAAAYVTLMADRIMLGPKEKPKGVAYSLVPALKVAQLGVDVRFQRRGLGEMMIGYAVQMARTFRGMMGCRYITLDARPELIGWYERQGFKLNKEEQASREEAARKRGIDLEHFARSMRFDLREAEAG
jgi:ribosomal protein S18 acetylase RimI-like enzyme